MRLLESYMFSLHWGPSSLIVWHMALQSSTELALYGLLLQYKTQKLRYPNLILSVQWFSILTMPTFWHFLPFYWNLFVALSQCDEGIIGWQQKWCILTLFVANQWFLCRTDSVQQTNFNKMAKNAKKEDMVKIENHCAKKIRLGYLEFSLWPELSSPARFRIQGGVPWAWHTESGQTKEIIVLRKLDWGTLNPITYKFYTKIY